MSMSTPEVPFHDELTGAAGVIAGYLDGLPVRNDVEMVFAVDDGRDGLLVVAAEVGDEDATIEEEAANLLATPRRIAAMATRIGWTPNPTGPTAMSWLITVVAPGQAAFAVVRRVREDVEWTHVPSTALPPLAWWTAQALTQALQTGAPLRFLTALDLDLYRPPGAAGGQPRGRDAHR
jgi:hypothetical protein